MRWLVLPAWEHQNQTPSPYICCKRECYCKYREGCFAQKTNERLFSSIRNGCGWGRLYLSRPELCNNQNQMVRSSKLCSRGTVQEESAWLVVGFTSRKPVGYYNLVKCVLTSQAWRKSARGKNTSCAAATLWSDICDDRPRCSFLQEEAWRSRGSCCESRWFKGSNQMAAADETGNERSVLLNH